MNCYGRPIEESIEGEHFETEGQLPHSGAIAGREPANSCGFVDLLQEPYGAGIWPLFGESGKGNRRRKGNEDYLEHNRIETWIFTAAVNTITHITSCNSRCLSFAHLQLPKALT